MERRVTVRGIIEKEGKLFCVRQKHSDGSINDFWCTPGGGLEPRESLYEGLKRELNEELGVEPSIGTLLAIQQYQENQIEFLEFFFSIENVDDYTSIDLENTSHGKQELVEYDFIDPRNVYILPKFLSKYPHIPSVVSYL
jgi:8-oxo-dGTP pyrophosphatase MutT (NUDIX family)